MHDGELTTVFDILLEETDPRYVVAELDVLWAADALGDITGAQVAALINKWYTPAAGQTPASSRVQLLHMKDGINIDDVGNASPRAIGTGELDFLPILAAAKGKVRYYHQEQDGGTTTDAETSFNNLKGINTAVVPTLLALPRTFQSVRPGEESQIVAVLVENTGDVPLTITDIAVEQHALDAPSAADFHIVGENCTAAGGGGPLWTRGICVVNVVFEPLRSTATSVARLQFTSNSDDAANSVLLAATSLNNLPVVTKPANQAASRGVGKFFSLGSFTDLGADGPWNVEVDWGDGSPHTLSLASAPGALGLASHVYAASGTYAVVVKVTDEDLDFGQASFQIKVTPQCVVPKLRNKTLSAAKSALRAANCQLGKVTTAFSSTIKKGRVIKQAKAPGARLAERDEDRPDDQQGPSALGGRGRNRSNRLTRDD